MFGNVDNFFLKKWWEKVEICVKIWYFYTINETFGLKAFKFAQTVK